MNNKVCVKINCYKGFSYNETFDGIKNAGFRYVELSTSKGNSVGLFQDSSYEKLKEIKDDLDARNIIPIAIGGNSFIMDDDKSKILKNIELAKYFGCKYVDTTIYNARNDKDSDTSDADVADYIKYYVPYLEKNNLKLVIELHGNFSTGKRLLNILKLVNSDNVCINYDTGNALYWGKLSVEEMLLDLKECADYVGYVHMKDKLGNIDEWNFPSLGSGYIPFDKIFNILKDNDACLCTEIEFTEKGVSSVDEVHKALKDSALFLKKQGCNLE